MTTNRTKPNGPLTDAGYWSIVADFIERRDRGDPVTAADYAAGNPELARRFHECIEALDWMGQALCEDVDPGSAEVSQDIPERIGQYRIIREIGRGGMGVVYEAEHKGLGRRVALKVLFASRFQERSARERFDREAKTIATLHHTNIVPIFEVGTADGHHYFAMQMIEGRTLEQEKAEESDSGASVGVKKKWDNDRGVDAASSRAAGMDPYEVAHLGLQAAEALAYAHSRGVVHRDVKPSNLIVDRNGALWVVDFGLAKGLGDPTVTASGARLGTPRYMSPEQATSRWEAIDARSDIYSLGVTLYELLTGQLLFPDSTPQQLILRIIRTDPPSPRQLQRGIPRDLETIVLKAMAKQPSDRYGSAQKLADDLRRFLAHEPVQARRIGPLGRLARWCRREPLVATVSLVALVMLSVVASTYHIRLTRQRDAARNELADSLLQQASATRSTQRTGRRWQSLRLLQRSAEIRPRPELSVEAIQALQLFDVRLAVRLSEVGGPVPAVAFAPGSRHVALATADSDLPAVTIWDIDAKSISSHLPAPESVNFLQFSRDGHLLAGTTEQHICLWELDTGKLRVLPGGRPGLSTVAFSPDGRRLAGFAGGLCLWDTSNGQLERRLVDAEVDIGLVSFTADGRFLAASFGDRTEVLRWSLPDFQRLAPLGVAGLSRDPLAHAMGVLALATSQSGSTLGVTCGDSRIQLWDIPTGTSLGELDGHRAPVTALAFCKEGEWLVSTDGFEVKLWDVPGQIELATLLRPDSLPNGPLNALAMSDDGRWLACGGERAELWEFGVPTFTGLLARHPDKVTSAASSPDGRLLAWAGEGRLRLWQRARRKLLYDLAIAPRDEVDVVFGHAGRLVAVAGKGAVPIQLFDTISGRLRAEWSAEPATAATISPDGHELAVAHTDNVIRRWDIATGQITGTLVGHTGPVEHLVYSPNGKQLAAGKTDRSGPGNQTLQVWDINSGRIVHQLAAHRAVTFGVAFSPDGAQIASCGGDRKVKLWNAKSGELLATLDGHSQLVSGVQFSPDGLLLASCGRDGQVLVWDANSLLLLARLTGRVGRNFNGVAFTPADHQIISWGGPRRWLDRGPGVVECWDLTKLSSELERFGLGWIGTKSH